MITITRFFFKTDQEYKKACDTLDKAIKDIQTEHFDHGKNAENKELWVIDPKKAMIVEGLFKQNGITQYDKKTDETSWIGPENESKKPMITVASMLRRIKMAMGKTVGINDFVKRQTKSDFAGTKVTMAQLEDLRKKAEQDVNAGKDRKGYADFVHIVSVNEPDILCNIAKITPQNEKLLKTEMTKRREGEEEYEHRFFESKDVKGIPSHHVDIILYTKEQLDKEGEKNTGSDFDIISINAEISEKGAPIAPVTMRRNIKGPASGGSGHQHTEEEIGESEKFWEQHALIK